MIASTVNYQNALAAFSSGKLVYRLEIAGYSRVFTNLYDGVANDWIEEGSISELNLSINDLEGSSSLSSFSVTVSDVGGAITADFPTFIFEGAKVVLRQGFEGLATVDFVTLFTGFIDSVDSANANQSYIFNLVDITAKLSKVIYLTGDNGGPTSGDNIKTLNAHPIDIMVDILLNKVGLDPSFVDTTNLYAYRDGPFAGTQFLFHLSQSPAAADFIQKQLLKPLGGYLWINSLGQITARFFYPLAGPVAVATLGPDTWESIPEAQQTDMVNTVQVSFDKDDLNSSTTGNYLNVATQLFGPSVAKYNQYGEHTIVADGMRSGFQGFFLAALTARMIFMRYGFKNLKFDAGAADGILQLLLIETGDIVAVTHPNIPDRTNGVIGVTNRLFEVLDKKINFTEGKIRLTLLDASYLNTFGFYKIAPANEADHGSASSGDKVKYMFYCNDSGQYADTTPGHILG